MFIVVMLTDSKRALIGTQAVRDQEVFKNLRPVAATESEGSGIINRLWANSNGFPDFPLRYGLLAP